MSRHTKTLRMGDGNRKPAQEQSVESPMVAKTVVDDCVADASTPARTDAATSGSVASDDVTLARITARTLERYLAAAESDREAAEERADRAVARFARLTTAMVALTMVIAGANVVMMLRQSSASQPVVIAPPSVAPPAVAVPPAPPAPSPPPVPAQAEPAKATPAPAAEKIHLLGKPLDQAIAARAAAPAQPHLARATIKPAPLKPMLPSRTQAISLEEADRAERW